ncbi:MAG: hypothetical protein M3Y35_04295 [Actinomycetota bacterium]|nr:hypothetical protein [Actinomycetota bacterium]
MLLPPLPPTLLGRNNDNSTVNPNQPKTTNQRAVTTPRRYAAPAFETAAAVRTRSRRTLVGGFNADLLASTSAKVPHLSGKWA